MLATERTIAWMPLGSGAVNRVKEAFLTTCFPEADAFTSSKAVSTPFEKRGGMSCNGLNYHVKRFQGVDGQTSCPINRIEFTPKYSLPLIESD